MANNSLFNSQKSLFSKNLQLNCSDKMLPNINNNNLLQKQMIDIIKILSIYYRKKEENNKIENFLEKITQLNKYFNSYNEKYIFTKSSLDKLSNDLFMNLFRQIDCCVEEIQRLNKKIMSVNNKDYKEKIKKLNEEISENKEKIKKYENEIKEKSKKEEKLIKEIDYYKKRLIFFKNKININLISRNMNSPNTNNIKRDKSKNKNTKVRKSYFSSKSHNFKYLNNYISNSPQRPERIYKHKHFLNSI